MKIRIPATTANMGPGFDCIGMALQMYNFVTIEESEKSLIIESASHEGHEVPLGESNLIYQSMLEFSKHTGTRLPGVYIKQEDNIPMTRGLGSSAACIVAGLVGANELTNAKLSKKEIAELASMIEGHPDNAAPAVLGNMIIAAQDKTQMQFVSISVPNNVKCLTLIPDFHLSTEKARSVLPSSISREDSVFNISRASLLVAKMLSGDIGNLNFVLQDRLHQPYRMPLIPEMDKIFESAEEVGVGSIFLSGAGPTLIALVNDDYDMKVNAMEAIVKKLDNKWKVKLLDIDTEGVTLVE